jgi:hypothetical protein
MIHHGATGSVVILAQTCGYLAAIISRVLDSDQVFQGHLTDLERVCERMTTDPDAAGGVARGAMANRDDDVATSARDTTGVALAVKLSACCSNPG